MSTFKKTLVLFNISHKYNKVYISSWFNIILITGVLTIYKFLFLYHDKNNNKKSKN